MAIEYRCVKCGKLLRVADQYAGQQAKCPDCGTQMAIPYASAPPAGGAAQPPAPPSGNPYASPAMGGGASSTSIDMGDIFGTTWSIFKREWPTCVIMALVASLVPGLLWIAVYAFIGIVVWITNSGFLAMLIGFVGFLAIMACAVVMQYGLLRGFLKIVRGEQTAIGELFQFTPDVLPFLGVSVLVLLLVDIGMMLCVVPGFIALAIFLPAIFLVLDRKVPVFDALGQSKDLTINQLWPLCLLWLVAWLGAIGLAVITCGLGGLISSPFILLMMCVLYLRLTNQPIVQ